MKLIIKSYEKLRVHRGFLIFTLEYRKTSGYNSAEKKILRGGV